MNVPNNKETLMSIQYLSQLSSPPASQDTRLSSRDRVWILTDIYDYWSSFYAWSPEQEWFEVGALNLRTERLEHFSFSIDDARAMLRAGVPAPPWKTPLPFALEVSREGHADTEKGRYRVVMTPELLAEDLVAVGRVLRTKFATHAGRVNAKPGMWQPLVDRVALEKKIEAAALGMTDVFSSGDVKALVGKKVNVSRVLRDLVEDGRLVKTGERRGTRYEVAP
jgi:hypothetical protein